MYNLFARYIRFRKTYGCSGVSKICQRRICHGKKNVQVLGGTSTDIIIEQTSNRAMKALSEGLTHGRGVTEPTMSKFILTTPFFINIMNSIEALTGVTHSTSDEHVKTSDTTIERESTDMVTLINFFQKYYPFKELDLIISSRTGNKANETINFRKADKIGVELVRSTYDKKFGELEVFKKTNIVKNLQSKYSVKVGKIDVGINPTLIFQRIAASKRSEKDLMKNLCYELAPWRQSVFGNNLLRKSKESDFYQNFDAINKPVGQYFYVIGGEFVLHKMVWPKNATFS